MPETERSGARLGPTARLWIVYIAQIGFPDSETSLAVAAHDSEQAIVRARAMISDAMHSWGGYEVTQTVEVRAIYRNAIPIYDSNGGPVDRELWGEAP
jgi:hypothetical protein